MELLILADDLTGALDTGIQFVDKGANTRVILDPCYSLEQVASDVQVLVIDTESRHIEAIKAAALVRNIVRQAVALHVPCIYKKTDSALRGNVGTELGAALEASGAEQLHFIPAYPKTKRITIEGIHYIDGVPVAQSVFGKDPFNPVRSSCVSEIISSGTSVPVVSVKKGDSVSCQKGIQVYDAETDQDLLERGLELQSGKKPLLLAGCAGFASILADLQSFHKHDRERPRLPSAFLMACGSVNPITKEQIKRAVKSGLFRYFSIYPEESLTPHWFMTMDGEKQIDTWVKCLENGEKIILDTNDVPGHLTAYEYANQHGQTLETLHNQLPLSVGEALKKVVERNLTFTLMVTGGDVLMGFMNVMGLCEIEPVQELFTGTVLSYIDFQGKKQPLISKSGGFGNPDVLVQIASCLG